MWGFHSGITSSTNPIYETFDGRIVFDPVPADPNNVPIIGIYNTADPTIGPSTWDITVSGWILKGGVVVENYRT